MALTQQTQYDETQPECQPRKYQRRSGSSNQKGTKYEIKMTALIYLRALRLLRSSFFLGVNDLSAGGFDDIVLQYVQDGEEHKLCMQLKHIQNTVIPKASLASEDGKFSLKKKFDSVKTKCSSCNTLFILFTNAPVCLTPSRASINETGTTADLLWTSGCIGSQIFGVDINDEVCKSFKDEPEAQEFINKFIIFSEQLDEDQLDEIIKQEFIKYSNGILPDYRILHTNYLEKIEDYWQATGTSNYLTEHSKEWKAIVPILFENSNLLPQITFNDQTLSRLTEVLLHPNYSVICIKCTDTNSSVRCLKVNQALLKHTDLQKYIFTTSHDLELNKNIRKLWKNNWYDLIVINEQTRTFPLKLDDLGILQNNVNKKVVIVSDGSEDMSDTCSNIVESCRQVNETLSLDQLSVPSRELVLDQTLQLQGKEVTLRDIKVEKVLQGERLTHFLNNKGFTIGHSLLSPNGSYIPRTLHKNIIIKNDIFSLKGVSDKFYIIGLQNRELHHMVRAGKVKSPDDLLQNTLSGSAAMGIKDSSQQNPQFETTNESKLSALIHNITSSQDDIPVHILQCKDGLLYWRESFKDSTQLYQFIDCSEGEMEDTKTFLKSCMTSTPEEHVLASAKLKKVIVAGDPGMGKSNLLQSVSVRLKELYPESWIILLNLETSIKYLKEKEKGVVNKESVVRMLATAIDIHESPTYITFLQEAIENRGNVCILCDGFDETCPEYAESVLQVLEFIQQETKVASLWVSSRQVAVERLENCLQAKAFYLQPMTKQEIFSYLSETLETEEVQNIFDMFQEITPDGTNPIIGSPLYLMMIRDLIPRKKFLTTRNRINLYELYSSFMGKRLEIYLDNVVKETHSTVRDIYAEHFMKFHMICSVVALDVLNELSEEQRHNILGEFDKHKSNIVKGSEKTGIIDGLTDNGQPHFIHRTFAEFFLALWLEENKTMNSKFIGKITFDSQQNVLRTLLNQCLAKECPIHLAVLNNDLPSLQQQLENSVELNSKDGGGRTPLHLACIASTELAIEMMKVLLNHCQEVDLEVKDNFLNSTPLYYAVRAKLWGGVRLLLNCKAHVENGTSLNQLLLAIKGKLSNKPVFDLKFEINWPIFSENKTVLHIAAQSGLIKCIEILIAEGANLELEDAHGNRPLHDALRNGKPKAALLLLFKNACVQAVNQVGDTPLHISVRDTRNEEVVSRLLELKANINARNRTGDTPLHDAVKHGDRHAVMQLLHHRADVKVKNKDRNTPLHVAVSTETSDQLCVFDLLVENGAPTAAVNKDGDTPLHLAVKKNNILMVIKLLNCKASLETKNRYGNTPLHIAIRKRNRKMDIIELLLKHGASTSAQTKHGETALHLAVWLNKLKLVKILLAYNASVAIKNRNGETPLHDAVKRGNHKIILKLLAHEAPVNVMNKDGDTPLHNAAKHRNLRAVTILLQRGAHGDAVNKDGDTALHVAIRKQHSVIAVELLRFAVSVTIRNNRGDTPLDEAFQLDSSDLKLNMALTHRHLCA